MLPFVVQQCLNNLPVDFALTEAAYTIVRLLQEFPTMKLPEREAVELVGVEKQAMSLVMSVGMPCRISTA
jgi:hypothetical protein